MIPVIGAVIIIALLYAAAGGKRTKPTAVGSPAEGPTFQILALGFKESGKTTLLAAMFHVLCNGSRAGISLRAQDPTRAALLKLCDVIRNPSGRIHATLETASYEFVVRAESETLPKTTVCKLVYHDYAGENGANLLRPGPGEEPDPMFVKALHDAHIVMGLLDGARIAELMATGPTPAFERELADLLLLLTEARQQTIHLVITKWDLLYSAYTLDQIVERLRWFPQFLAFQDTPRPGRIRIIPVAALGTNGFTSRVAGVDVRDPNRDWRPLFVDVPLACTIPDVIDAQLRSLVGSGAGGAGAAGAMIRWSQLSEALTWFLRTVGSNITFQYGVAGINISALFSGGVNGLLERSADWRTGGPVRAGAGGDPTAGHGRRAALNAIRYFKSVVDEFERSFPGSAR